MIGSLFENYIFPFKSIPYPFLPKQHVFARFIIE